MGRFITRNLGVIGLRDITSIDNGDYDQAIADIEDMYGVSFVQFIVEDGCLYAVFANSE